MAFSRIDCAPPMVGAIVIEGYQVLANYKNEFILAQALNQKNPEPWVVWNLDNDGDPYGGSYCASLESAQVCFVERCFPWFWEESKKDSPSPETMIDFSQEYNTHRIGFYKGWMIVQPADEMDGEILCFLPSDEFDDSEYPELEYIKDYFTAEWEAGSLREIIDFIDSY